MSTWLLIEFVLSTGAVILTLVAVCRKQVASPGFKIGALIATVGLAGHAMLSLYDGLGVLSEPAFALQALVFGNATACAILMARLATSESSESKPV